MANAVKEAIKEAIKEKVEVIGQIDDMYTKKGFNFWLLIPATMAVATATGAFFWVRRVLKHKEA